MAILLTIVAFSFFIIYLQKSKVEYVSYDENSSIDYKVYLKENNFFKEKYLDKNNEYIASLIDYINAQFKYDITLDRQNVAFEYTKRIEAEVEVYNANSKKPLYKVTEELLGSTKETSTNKKTISINENVKIDYNHYNDLIRDFKKEYGLINANSYLTIKMYVSVNGNCDDLESEANSESVISLIIPLTTKTMSIEIESDLVENANGLMVCRKGESFILFLFVSVGLFVLAVISIVLITNYIIKSRTPRDIYKRELKKILSNYHSFIQKINGEFDLTGYQILKVDTFTDMLEIRDTLSQPILMVENKEKMVHISSYLVIQKFYIHLH